MSKDGINVGEAISAGKEILMNMINELIEELRPTMSLEDLQRVYIKTIDAVIFKEELATVDQNIDKSTNKP